jgi:histidine ammonia-lyase
VVIDGSNLTLDQVDVVARGRAMARLSEAAIPGIHASRTVVEKLVQEGRVAYGITTGFGSLSDCSISSDQAGLLQANLLRSHAAGAGNPLPIDLVRAAMLLRANSLAKGYSGVRPLVVQTLLDLLNAGIHPIVPCQGSLGASGDLAPLSHLSLPLIGLGEVELDGEVVEAAVALRRRGVEPLTLEPKEALALINGTQIITSLATLALLDAERLVESAVAVAGLSLVALAAKRAPLDERVQAVRPHPGQVKVAHALRTLLAGQVDEQIESKRVQDPYSLRCIPQVYGAIHDALHPLRAALETEVNAATDNPLIFTSGDGTGDVISGGNFHGHPLALTCDAAKIAVASLGTIIERRVALLVDGEDRGLPHCLVKEPGLNSGYMIAHYLAAGLVAENRVLAHPSSVDSIPTSANVEDYNSMGATAARHLRQVVTNVERVLAVEALCAAQGCDLRGYLPNGPLGDVYRRIRERVPMLERDDRIMGDDIGMILELLREGGLRPSPPAPLP